MLGIAINLFFGLLLATCVGMAIYEAMRGSRR